MLIEWVELINFGSYVQQRIHFTPGTNAIVGANGSGKSTIREAVAFVVFNKTSRKLSELLREGARSGTVTVGLISSLDDRHYEIERRFTGKTTTRYGVYDAEAGRQCVAEGVSDVEEWVRQHLRIDTSVNLGMLFETTVGVPQGMFTTAFGWTSSDRKRNFDRVLDVDSYTRASDNLRPAVRILAKQAATYRTEIARLEGMLSGLSALQAEGTQLKGDLSGLVDAIATKRQSLACAEENLLKLNEAQAHVKEAEQTLAAAKVRQDAHQPTLQAIQRALLEAQTAKETVQIHLAAHLAYQDADSKLEELDASRRVRDGLLEKQRKARVALVRLADAKAREPEAQRELEAADLRATEIAQGVIQATHVEDDLKRSEEQLKIAQATSQELMRSIGSQQAAITTLSKQNELLTDADIPACPTCGTELTADHRQDLLARNQVQINDRNQNLAELMRRRSDVLGYIKIHQDHLQAGGAQLRALPTPLGLSNARKESRRRLEVLATLRLEISSGAADQNLVERLDRDLASYADLNNQLSRFQDQRRANQTAHDTYMSNLTVAGEINKRQDEHREAQLERARLEQAYKKASAAYDVARAAYDAQMHANVQREDRRLRTSLAASEAQVTLKRERLTVVKKSLLYLETAQADLDKVTTELQDTEETHATIQWGRELLREAGPLVTRRLVRQISQEASSIYGELMGDSGRRLQWSEDYEISLDGRGYKRTFAQLSGGEKMVAALAVRWAIVRGTSAIDIAFYDEPTANLDPERRQAVAAIIARLKGPSQTFVMSHCGAFEADADNTIRILKDETGSHVVA